MTGKSAVLGGLLLLLSFSTHGQVAWGIKGGLNVSTLGTNSNVYTPRLAYHTGIYYRQRLEQQYGLQFELQYSQQGARDATIFNRRLSYNYLHLPILMKFYLAQDAFIAVGPQVSYLLKANSVEEGFKQDITEGLRKWDLSVVVGLGKEGDFGNYGFRFGWGVFNTSGASVGTSSLVFRNLLLQLYVGFKLQEQL
jgi:hypothetical protein